MAQELMDRTAVIVPEKSRELNLDELFKASKPTREKIIEEIKQLHRAGVSLKAAFIKREYNTLYAKAQEIFGVWGKAVKVAGINPKDILRTTFIFNNLKSTSIIGTVFKPKLLTNACMSCKDKYCAFTMSYTWKTNKS